MTVVNAMPLDEGGGMVADRLTSSFSRKYDYVEKIVTIRMNGMTALVGGSGLVDTILKATSRMQEGMTRNSGLRDLVRDLGQQLITIKRGMIDFYIRSTFGCDTTAAQTGMTSVDGTQVQINPQLYQQIVQAYTGQNPGAQGLFDTRFLVVGRDAAGTRTYVADNMTTPFRCSHYGTIGSGQEQSDSVLGQFMHALPRRHRQAPPFVDGMAALIRATNMSMDVNHGVGGIPSIVYFSERGITTLEDPEALLAAELVRAADAGLVQKDVFRGSLEDLLRGKKKARSVERSAFGDGQRYANISRFLRGYPQS